MAALKFEEENRMRLFALGFIAGATLAAVALLLLRPAPRARRGGVTVSKAVLDTRVLTMTPKELTERCGKPVKDRFIRSPFDNVIPGSDERDITIGVTLPDGSQREVTATFSPTTSSTGQHGWALESVGGYQASLGLGGELNAIEELFPCTTKP
jgi:hypothetical protein